MKPLRPTLGTPRLGTHETTCPTARWPNWLRRHRDCWPSASKATGPTKSSELVSTRWRHPRSTDSPRMWGRRTPPPVRTRCRRGYFGCVFSSRAIEAQRPTVPPTPLPLVGLGLGQSESPHDYLHHADDHPRDSALITLARYHRPHRGLPDRHRTPRRLGRASAEGRHRQEPRADRRTRECPTRAAPASSTGRKPDRWTVFEASQAPAHQFRHRTHPAGLSRHIPVQPGAPVLDGSPRRGIWVAIASQNKCDPNRHSRISPSDSAATRGRIVHFGSYPLSIGWVARPQHGGESFWWASTRSPCPARSVTRSAGAEGTSSG
jgi:hypothetical protein